MCVYTIEEIAERIRPVAKKYNIDKVYLFGSYARGEATEESDVDLLIGNINSKKMFALPSFYADAQEALEKNVDVLTLNSLKNNILGQKMADLLKNNIEKDRRLLYEDR